MPPSLLSESRPWWPVLVAAAVLIPFPLFANKVVRGAEPPAAEIALAPVKPRGTWSETKAITAHLSPAFKGADAEVEKEYVGQGRRVYLYLAGYTRQSQGDEVISDVNRLYDSRLWRPVETERRTVTVDGPLKLDVGEVQLESLRGQESARLMWYWYSSGGRPTASRYMAKALQVWGMLTGRRDAAAVIVSAELRRGQEDARVVLHAFLEDMMPAIEQALRQG